MLLAVISGCAGFPIAGICGEIHVATTGDDANDGSPAKPLRTIQAAAGKAQPGDTVTVHAGVYRERVNPPRGGESDEKRIVYQAAAGEKVTITGSDRAQGWQPVGKDTWKLVLPNSYFGKFNPYAEKVSGDWFDSRGRTHHRGCVYLNGAWLAEAPGLDAVMQSAGPASPAGQAAGGNLLNVAWLQPGGADQAGRVPATSFAAKQGTQNAGCSEGGECLGYIKPGDWARYDRFDFGRLTEQVEIRVASETDGGTIELRLDKPDGELLGTCSVGNTGGWQSWVSLRPTIKPTRGSKTLCLVFKASTRTVAKPAAAPSGLWFATVGETNTTLWAGFPGVDPNKESVEIIVRPTVFTPEKTNIDYLTIRGFDLRNAGTTWAAPTAGQGGLVTAYWCKGWIIEHNEISYSRCCGIALGKYSDEWDGQRGSAEGFCRTVEDAIKKGGWSREKIGGHIVHNNHIHHCGQTGIVGSLGCAFSKIIGNEIHDINMQGIWGGAEMAGIKFHGGIDVVVSGNQIYRCGELGGLWLDWMAQGPLITDNLFHDNHANDLFLEVNHGPFLVANNLFLSPVMQGLGWGGSQGGAFAHNLIAGRIARFHGDGRGTQVMKPHSTELSALKANPVGDVRWCHNIFANGEKFGAYDAAELPVTARGNVFVKGAAPSKYDKDALLKPDFDTGVKITEKDDGWYLELNTDGKWAAEQKRPLVTTELLGKAIIPDQPFTNPDGSPLKIDTDYSGNPRNPQNPFPGPFETVKDGKQEIKVWPRK